jgi:phage terminase large subunit GpA-like protein
MTVAAAALADGRRLVFGALARGLRPDPPVRVSDWAERYRRVPVETSQFPGRWSNETAPYLREIMDACGPEYPAERVTVKKSAQVGYSEALTNVIGAMIDAAPGPAMVVHPTVEAAKNWVAEKLDLTVRATPALRAKVREAVSRDATGSTSKRKRYPGGFLIVTGANSTRELRQRSIRYLIKDDWSDWPLDVDGQGDPDKMAEARTLGFQSSGQVKIIEGSTPTVKGVCRVTAAYERSDKRVFLVPCPHCGHEQQLRFFPDAAGRGGLRWDDGDPSSAWYACEDCGGVIEEHQKRAMLVRGRWRATEPGPGRHPGFHISALYSPFTTWSRIAERFLEAKDEPAKLKVWTNLDLGEAWEERGEAPDWDGLMKRAEDYRLGRVPTGALIIVIGCDVQKDGIFYEIVAWGRGRETWSIGADFLPGDTADIGSTAWVALTKLYETKFEIDGGEPIGVDMLAIDAGYNTDAVCEWVRGKPQAFAVRGVDGWEKSIFGAASKVDVNWKGERRKRSAKIWPVYVWNLKGTLYANLRKEPMPGDEQLPAGYCHFPTAYGPAFYQQLTGDHLKEIERRGRRVMVWTTTRANHFHDCRIYAMAAYHRAAQLHRVVDDAAAAWAQLEAARRPGRPQGELALDRDAVAAPPPATATLDQVTRQTAPAPRWHRMPRRPGGFVKGWRL